MASAMDSIAWLETWSSKQFAGVASTLPPAEPSLDETDIKARLEIVKVQVRCCRVLQSMTALSRIIRVRPSGNKARTDRGCAIRPNFRNAIDMLRVWS